MEMARGERIEYKNARGYYNRMEAAIKAHMDDVNKALKNVAGGKSKGKTIIKI